MKNISMGIIGCGDVSEVKSGPAFTLIEGSRLVAIMRRDASKAKDYAQRHNSGIMLRSLEIGIFALLKVKRRMNVLLSGAQEVFRFHSLTTK